MDVVMVDKGLVWVYVAHAKHKQRASTTDQSATDSYM